MFKVDSNIVKKLTEEGVPYIYRCKKKAWIWNVENELAWHGDEGKDIIEKVIKVMQCIAQEGIDNAVTLDKRQPEQAQWLDCINNQNDRVASFVLTFSKNGPEFFELYLERNNKIINEKFKEAIKVLRHENEFQKSNEHICLRTIEDENE